MRKEERDTWKKWSGEIRSCKCTRVLEMRRARGRMMQHEGYRMSGRKEEGDSPVLQRCTFVHLLWLFCYRTGWLIEAEGRGGVRDWWDRLRKLENGSRLENWAIMGSNNWGHGGRKRVSWVWVTVVREAIGRDRHWWKRGSCVGTCT